MSSIEQMKHIANVARAYLTEQLPDCGFSVKAQSDTELDIRIIALPDGQSSAGLDTDLKEMCEEYEGLRGIVVSVYLPKKDVEQHLHIQDSPGHSPQSAEGWAAVEAAGGLEPGVMAAVEEDTGPLNVMSTKLKLRPPWKFKAGQCCSNRCKQEVKVWWGTEVWLCDKHHQIYKKKAKAKYVDPGKEVIVDLSPREELRQKHYANTAPAEATEATEAIAPVVAAANEQITALTIPQTAAADLPEKEAQLTQWLAEVQAFEVTDQAHLDVVKDLLGVVKSIYKDVEAKRQDLVKPLNHHVKTVNGWFKPSKDLCTQLEGYLKNMILQATKAFEMQRIALAEKAIAAQAEGNMPQVHADMVAASNLIPDMKGVQSRTNWVYRVVDASIVPREYLCVDERKVADTVRAQKGDTQIPGIEVLNQPTLAVR